MGLYQLDIYTIPLFSLSFGEGLGVRSKDKNYFICLIGITLPLLFFSSEPLSHLILQHDISLQVAEFHSAGNYFRP